MKGALTGKIALVTGASRGIGRAIAARLAAEGAAVAVHYNAAKAQAEAVVAAIEAQGGTAFPLQADLSSHAGAQTLAVTFIAALTARFGSDALDILVNNAGVGRRAAIEDVSEEDFDRIVQVNLKSPFFLIKALLPQLRDGGRIVNISSMGTRVAYPEMAAYARERERLVRDHLGKIALIRFDEVVGVFDNVDDAIIEGYKRFGDKRMIFREITARDDPEYIANVDLNHPCIRKLGPGTTLRDHGKPVAG